VPRSAAHQLGAVDLDGGRFGQGFGLFGQHVGRIGVVLEQVFERGVERGLAAVFQQAMEPLRQPTLPIPSSMRLPDASRASASATSRSASGESLAEDLGRKPAIYVENVRFS
jgi:hypothetical protein